MTQEVRSAGAVPVTWDERRQELAGAGVPVSHRHCTFANFIAGPDLDVTTAMWDEANRLRSRVRQLWVGPAKRIEEAGPLPPLEPLAGPVATFLWSHRPGEPVACGSGKTHLAVAYMRACGLPATRSDPDMRFVRETEMLLHFREAIASHSVEHELLRYASPQLLVLDDFGRGKTARDSGWLQELLFELAARREGKDNLVTSNYSPDQLATSAPDLYLPLISRLLAGQNRHVYRLTGPDRR